MKEDKKKFLKNPEKSKDKNPIQKITNIDGKFLSILKQSWDKIEKEYENLMKRFEKFNEYLKETEIKKEYNSLITLLSSFKNNFKNIFFNVGINMANISNNTSQKIIYSYDNIYNEITDLELEIEDISSIQNNYRKNKKMKMQKLENKLHEFMDDAENFDFNKIEKYYDVYKLYKKNELEKILLQNNFIEKYNTNKENYKNNVIENDLLNINTLNHDSDNLNSINK